MSKITFHIFRVLPPDFSRNFDMCHVFSLIYPPPFISYFATPIPPSVPSSEVPCPYMGRVIPSLHISSYILHISSVFLHILHVSFIIPSYFSLFSSYSFIFSPYFFIFSSYFLIFLDIPLHSLHIPGTWKNSDPFSYTWGLGLGKNLSYLIYGHETLSCLCIHQVVYFLR